MEPSSDHYLERAEDTRTTKRNTSTVPTAATLHDTAHCYGAPASVLAARRAFFAALAAAAFAFFASAFAAYINHR
jgi:hypothetical protein